MVDNEKILSKIHWKSNPVAKRDGSGFSPPHPLQVLLVTLGG